MSDQPKPKDDMRCVFLALDNQPTSVSALDAIRRVMEGPMAPYMFGVKANDLLHLSTRGGSIVGGILDLWPQVVFFLDLKLGDIADTDVNTLKRYCYLGEDRLLVTVSLSSSAKCFMRLAEEFPKLRVIGMGVPTDLSVGECIAIHRGGPAAVIQRWIKSLSEQTFIATRSSLLPIWACISSVDTLETVAEWDKIRILPGVRDPWMLKGGQVRTTGAVDALRLGAKFLVMGNQLLVGNPKAEIPISALESQQMTADALAKYFAELDG